jgi:glucose/arabinose dehydrogenase
VPLQCGGAPLVAFLEAGALRAVSLAPDGPSRPETLRGVPAERVADVGLGAHGLLVALAPDGAGQIVRVNAQCKLEAGWAFVDSVRIPPFLAAPR